MQSNLKWSEQQIKFTRLDICWEATHKQCAHLGNGKEIQPKT